MKHKLNENRPGRSRRPYPGTRVVLALLIALPLLGQTEPLSLEPLALEISDPAQTRGLAVLKITVPLKPLIPDKPGAWVCLSGESDNPAIRWLAAEEQCLSQAHFDALRNAKAPAIAWYALLRERKPARITISTLTPTQASTARLLVAVDPEQAKPGAPELLVAWVKARNQALESTRYRYFGPTQTSARRDPTPDPQAGQNLLAHWQTISALSYGGQEKQSPSGGGRRPRPGDTLNAFSLFSGEAAIQETLQQQLLNTNADTKAVLNHDIEELSGPEVPSHPFEQLLADRPGGDLAIARLVPPDRWFMQISDPGRALAWLTTIAENSGQLLGLSQQGYFDQALLERYLQRLHLSREFVEKLGPLAKQAALFGPDLYLQHGSHITLLAQAPAAPGLTLLTKLMLGVSGGEGTVQSYGENPGAYFARHGHWLIFSSSRTEAEQALRLARNKGRNSLGASAEFRYMLEQLPPAQPGLYVYLSDPFIRAMTGPKVKIAQLRRHQARLRLQLVTAAALLYQADRGTLPTLDELIAQRYVEPDWLQTAAGDRIALDEQHRAQSTLYGDLTWMNPLGDRSIGRISDPEAAGYKDYVAAYSRFWRTTFDPVAVRVEVGAKVRVETLILPLINNSIYDAVRASIGGDAVSLTLPALAPAPVTTLSFKLPPATLRQLERNAFRGFYSDGDGFLSDALGGQIHLALFDDEPLIALGSADLLGAFSGPFLSTMGRSGLFLYGGFLASVLTQPAAIFVELREDADTEALFNRLLPLLDFGFGRRTLERYGANGWVYTFNLENILRFHLYLRREGRYLIISNRSLASQTVAGDSLSTQANAALGVNFTQIQQLAPTLHLHAAQGQQHAWRKAVGQLLPLRWLGTASPAEAQALFQRHYGYKPVLPPGTPWPWPNPGEWRAPNKAIMPGLVLPAYHELSPEQRRGGPFQALERLQVSFKLVEEGVRVVLELTPRPTD